jgi:hypothetical protein
MHMTEEELTRIVESKLEARLAARKQAEEARLREEIAAEIRREENRKWHERVNARHPIQGPGDPVVEAKRRADMDARAKADCEHMSRINARPVEGTLAHARRRADAAGGGTGFKIKG